MQVLAELLVVLILVRLFGELSERIGQPSSVGEIFAGFLLAFGAAQFGSEIPFLQEVASSEALEIVASIGIFFLALFAGIEMEPEEMARSSGISMVVALGGMIVPLAAGIALAWIYLPQSDIKHVQVLLTGVTLSISAIPATVKVLAELNLTRSRIGHVIVTAAVFDDLIGLFLLTILLAVMQSGELPELVSILWLLTKVAMFVGITAVLGYHVYPHVHRGISALQIAAIDFSALAMVALAYGWLAELLDIHWIIGAFAAGLFFERSRVGVKAYNEIKLVCGTLTNGFLAPLFFAYIGMQVEIRALIEAPIFVAAIVGVAFLGKLIGAGVPALLHGFSRRESLAIGTGLSARGAVELVIVSIALEAGVFSITPSGDASPVHLYSALIIMGVMTTAAVPPLMKRILK